MEELTHISLFAGIGGIDLATEWAGFRTILFVEIDPYCQKVLKKHWPDVPIIGDIKDATKEKVMAYAKNWEQSKLSEGDNAPDTQERYEPRTSDRSRRGNITSGTKKRRGVAEAISSTAGIKPITLITGGFPCQPVSQAGKQRGKEDDRWLWPEMFRVIKEVRPKWVVAENVAGLIRMGIDDCLSDLENIGYTTEPYLIPACAINAPHRRDRIFIIAHDDSSGLRERWGTEPIREAHNPIECISQDVADTTSRWSRRIRNESREEGSHDGDELFGECGRICGQDQWAVEPNVGRVAHGVPSRVDRLKCLGNAVVPQQIYPILKAIADIETHKSSLENDRKEEY